MKKTIPLFGILTLGLTLACSTLTTNVDYDHTVDWSPYKTFMIAEGTKDPVTFTQKRIEDSITSTLTSKGWQAVTSNPGVLVYTHVRLSNQKQWTAQTMGGWGYRGWGGMGGGMTTATETNIPIGTLIVDLVDPAKKEMVWRGTATDQVSGSGEDKGKIQAAVQALFKNFPPGPGGK
jgi:hypothetical protein